MRRQGREKRKEECGAMENTDMDEWFVRMVHVFVYDTAKRVKIARNVAKFRGSFSGDVTSSLMLKLHSVTRYPPLHFLFVYLFFFFR